MLPAPPVTTLVQSALPIGSRTSLRQTWKPLRFDVPAYSRPQSVANDSTLLFVGSSVGKSMTLFQLIGSAGSSLAQAPAFTELRISAGPTPRYSLP